MRILGDLSLNTQLRSGEWFGLLTAERNSRADGFLWLSTYEVPCSGQPNCRGTQLGLVLESALAAITLTTSAQIFDGFSAGRAILMDFSTSPHNSAKLDTVGRTMPHRVASNEDARVPDLVLGYSTDPDTTDFAGTGSSPIAATRNRHHLEIGRIVRFGADFAVRDSFGRTTLETPTGSKRDSSVPGFPRDSGSASESPGGLPISRLICGERPESVTTDRHRARPALRDGRDEGNWLFGGQHS